MNIYKICTQCQRELDLDSFRKQSGTKDGCQYECKACVRRRAKKRYADQRDKILGQSKTWQVDNKEKHNAAALKYYNSVSARLNRNLNKRLDQILGKSRETFFHLVGTSASALIIHLAHHLKAGWSIDDYQVKWVVGFKTLLDLNEVKQSETLQRELFNWNNLVPVCKNIDNDDLSV